MKNYRILSLGLIVSLMMACNMAAVLGNPPTPMVVVVTQLVPANTDVPAAPPVPAVVVPAAAATLEPTLEPTREATPTVSLPMVTPLKDPVNCRFGPSVNYEQVFALKVGAFAKVTGSSKDGGWWQVEVPNGNYEYCWVAGSVVVVSGELAGIKTVAAPESLISNVSFKIKPDSKNLGPGCIGPFPTFSLKGSIAVNGPLEVKWHIETEQDGKLSDHKTSFLKFGTQDISFDYVPSYWKKGNFWVRLVISSPTNLMSDANYQIECK